MKYVITKNGELSTAYFESEEFAKALVKSHKNKCNEIENELKKKIELIYDNYDLNYGYSMHDEIFKHLLDTDFLEYEDEIAYFKAKKELEDFKNKKIHIGYVKE